jgi:hypothetical protein
MKTITMAQAISHPEVARIINALGAMADELREELASAVQAEREACAKLCDDLPAPDSCSGSESSLWDVATLECAAAIRARGDDAA